MKVDREHADEAFARLRAGGSIMPPMDERLAAFIASFASMVDEDQPDEEQPAWVRERNRLQRRRETLTP